MPAKHPAPKRRPSSAPDMSAYISSLAHPAEALMQALRQTILAVDPAIQEEVKWNAPSFCTSEHFATMHLREKQGLGLILHFGPRKNALSETGLALEDPADLLHWLAKDRAIIRFRDVEDLHTRAAALTTLLKAWIAHLPRSRPLA